MRPWRLLSGCFMLTLVSCQWGMPHSTPPDINKDTLTFTYQIIHQKIDNCGNPPDSACSYVKISYPVFKNAAILNDTLTKRLLNMYTAVDSVSNVNTSLQKYAADFLKQFEQRSDEKVTARDYTMDSRAQIMRQDSGLVTIYLKDEVYTGGTHTATLYSFINWNTKNSQVIKLDDILIKGYDEKLTLIADTIFRKNEKLSLNAPLTNYLFDNEKFALNNNFLITPTGILFLYNEHQIKPDAAGTTQIDIPYSKIKSLLLPHTVVSQYIK